MHIGLILWSSCCSRKMSENLQRNSNILPPFFEPSVLLKWIYRLLVNFLISWKSIDGSINHQSLICSIDCSFTKFVLNKSIKVSIFFWDLIVQFMTLESGKPLVKINKSDEFQRIWKYYYKHLFHIFPLSPNYKS